MKRIIVILITFLIMSCSDSDNIYYEVKGNEVLYHSVYRKGQEYYTKAHTAIQVVEGADANTFQQLTKYYGVDATNVFNEARKLVKRDAFTFKVFEKLVTGDKYGVYYDNNIIPNSHGLSFRFLNSGYAIDNNQVYYMPNSFNRVIKGADKATFVTIDNDYRNYAKDKNQVYYQGAVIEGANRDSFKKLDNNFSKDGSSIYYKGQRLNEADYDSFKILNAEAKKEHSYKYGAEDHNNLYDNSGHSAPKKSKERNEK